MYYDKKLYEIAKYLLDQCLAHNSQVIYYQIDKNGHKKDFWMQDLSKTAKALEMWIIDCERILDKEHSSKDNTTNQNE